MALKNLKGYEGIVIKETDRGSVLVVWGKMDYCKEALSQLLDCNIYEEIEDFSWAELNSRIDSLLSSLMSKGLIGKKYKEYLFVKKPRLGRFYFLPKKHKKLENVPGRPVISNCGTVTERI